MVLTNKNYIIKKVLLAIVLIIPFFVFSQKIASQSIITNNDLSSYLSQEIKGKLGKNVTNAELAEFFRQKFSERYFYDWKIVDQRFSDYNKQYPDIKSSHKARAEDHLGKFISSPQWKLPLNYKNGKPVNAYALRHLARQHKMVDIAYQYFYEDKNPKYITYFKEQLTSLNTALNNNAYEKIEDGNGVYEAFRSGYRVLNWLHIHNLFLGEKEYSDEDQLKTIATLLQHGAHLYKSNQEFKSGNHQTRGLSALAMLSVLFRDFEGVDKWYAHSMNLLEEHLRKEINDDGFQFERTVHYHMSDIGNYYYVYQLIKRSDLSVNEFWENKLNTLFESLVKIAYPDKSTPVLSDDTNEPWAEKNNVSGSLTLGYLLFNNPEYGYFANDFVKHNMYWFVSDKQLKMLDNIQKKQPELGSTEFTTTGYYIMREGWEYNDKMLIVSAGLDDKKPDHQHGDMLGVQAMANGKVLLPNYQVRYYLKDLELFKNSMTKNVALVDDELQGKKYTSNKGGSGFGKFKELPSPITYVWRKTEELDVYVGSHNGFENVGVDYTRQVINVDNDFWIVKDNFKSDKEHTYKQVWQGHYSTEEGAGLLRASFDNGTGFDIFQMNKIDEVIEDGRRGKQWSIVSKKNETDFNFITVLFPYHSFSDRINELSEIKNIAGWFFNSSKWELKGSSAKLLSKDNKGIAFSVKELVFDGFKINFSEKADVYMSFDKKELKFINLTKKRITIKIKKGSFSKKISLEKGQESIVALD